MTGFACTKIGATRERLAFWLAAGCSLAFRDGVYRLYAPSEWRWPRGPSPAPVPEKLAREAIAAGAALSHVDDLFGRAA